MNTNLIILGFLLLTVVDSAFAQQDADVVYKNGKIYTVNARLPWAQSVAIKSDLFLYVGKDEDIGAFVGPETRIVDLKGRMAMPGLHDAHQHLLKAQMREIDCKLPVPSIYSSASPWVGSQPCGVLPPLSVGEMTLRLYGALNYRPNRAHDLRYALNEA